MWVSHDILFYFTLRTTIKIMHEFLKIYKNETLSCLLLNYRVILITFLMLLATLYLRTATPSFVSFSFSIKRH